MDEGGHAAVLCKNDGGGVMSVPLTFPSAGLYRITFLAACRTAHYSGAYLNTWSDGAALASVSVSLGSTEAARVNPTNGSFARYELFLPPVTNGALTQTLTFRVETDANWAAALIDDVRVFRQPLLANPNFEDVTPAGIGWTFNRGDWECGITTPGEHSWTVTSPEGQRCLVMARQGSASQNVAFATAGTYEFSFLAAQSPTTAPGHDFAVTFNGMQVGRVQTEDTTFRRYVFRLPYVEAGRTYGLTLQGINSGGGWSASLIDAAILRKCDAEPEPFGAKAFEETVVSLAEGARLELDYKGTITLGGLWYDGVPCAGAMSAANTSFVRGTGCVLVKPKGAVLLLR